LTNQGKLLQNRTQGTLCFMRAYLGWALKSLSENINIFYRNIVPKMSCVTWAIKHQWRANSFSSLLILDVTN